MTAEQAVSQKSQISSLRNDQRARTLIRLSIATAIMLMQDQINMGEQKGRKMIPAQCDDCASTIIQTYWYMRPEEIIYVLAAMKSGRFKSPDDKSLVMDCGKICGSIDEYDRTERLDIVARKQNELRTTTEAESADLYSRLKLEMEANGGDINLLKFGKDKDLEEKRIDRAVQMEIIKRSQ